MTPPPSPETVEALDKLIAAWEADDEGEVEALLKRLAELREMDRWQA